MNYQIDVSSALTTKVEPRPGQQGPADTSDLLRSLIEIQRESLQLQKNTLAAQDHNSRWKAFLSRWNGEFPGLGDQCKKAVPVLERTYARLVQDLLDRLNDEDTVDNEFAMQDVLERFGVRLAQLGTLINLVVPLADASNASEPSSGSHS